MFRIDTDEDNVQVIKLTVEQIRSGTYIEDEELELALDYAQGCVFSGAARKRYVVIEVTE